MIIFENAVRLLTLKKNLYTLSSSLCVIVYIQPE